MGLTAMQRKAVHPLLRALTDRHKAAIIMHDAYPVLYEFSRHNWGKPLKSLMVAITHNDPQEVSEEAIIALREIHL